MSAGWAAHVVHHQSEEYNLTVALRLGAFQPAFSWVFYLPLALLGFPPAMFLAAASFNTLYQFWIHTRLIGRLGTLEWVLNTPSHHRVHHARNPKYIDRNHGGTLIVWDRLFGTFGQEHDEPVYGITKPLASWNPVWANLHQWSEMWDVARRAKRPLDKLRVLWKRPGWRPDDLGGSVGPSEVDRGSSPQGQVTLGSAARSRMRRGVPPGARSEMVIVCGWCQKYMGSKEPLQNPVVSHGICSDCVERDFFEDAPVLVVSRDRAEAIPVLQSLLRGAPEIAIVADRRANERRGANGKGNGRGHPLAQVADRRATDRRRMPSFYLV